MDLSSSRWWHLPSIAAGCAVGIVATAASFVVVARYSKLLTSDFTHYDNKNSNISQNPVDECKRSLVQSDTQELKVIL